MGGVSSDRPSMATGATSRAGTCCAPARLRRRWPAFPPSGSRPPRRARRLAWRRPTFRTESPSTSRALRTGPARSSSTRSGPAHPAPPKTSPGWRTGRIAKGGGCVLVGQCTTGRLSVSRRARGAQTGSCSPRPRSSPGSSSLRPLGRVSGSAPGPRSASLRDSWRSADTDSARCLPTVRSRSAAVWRSACTAPRCRRAARVEPRAAAMALCRTWSSRSRRSSGTRRGADTSCAPLSGATRTRRRSSSISAAPSSRT